MKIFHVIGIVFGIALLQPIYSEEIHAEVAKAPQSTSPREIDAESDSLDRLQNLLAQQKYTDLIYKFRGDEAAPTGLKIPTAPLVDLDMGETEMERKLESFLPEEQALIKLFYLGRELKPEELKLLNMDARLSDSNLFDRANGALRLKDLYIEPYRLGAANDMFLFSELPKKYQKVATDPNVYPTAYISKTSHILLDKVMRDNENKKFPAAATGADFGTGVGIQAIALLKTHPEIKTIYGLDIEGKSMELANLNAKFNKVSDRFEYKDNKVDLLSGETLDFAVSNPPFNIVPPAAKGKIGGFGEGGSDGLDVTKLFVDQAEKHLKPGASMFFYSQLAVADDEKTFLESYLNGKNFQTEMQHLPNRFNMTVEEYADALKSYMFKRQDAPSKVEMLGQLLDTKINDVPMKRISANFVQIKKSPAPAGIAKVELGVGDSQYYEAPSVLTEQKLERQPASINGEDFKGGAYLETVQKSKILSETMKKVLEEQALTDPDYKKLLEDLNKQ
jgi:methylase of polypeptide subunit release factors